jgi:hypothetical protein
LTAFSTIPRACRRCRNGPGDWDGLAQRARSLTRSSQQAHVQRLAEWPIPPSDSK